jgi:hypothetical protein
VAWGAAAPRLHARLQALVAAGPQQAKLLQATASRDVVIVTSQQAEQLPWVEGAAYAAPCDEAPALWLPTLQRPDAAPELLMRALKARHQRQPILLWPAPAALVPLDRLLPVTAELLARIGEHWQVPQAPGKGFA